MNYSTPRARARPRPRSLSYVTVPYGLIRDIPRHTTRHQNSANTGHRALGGRSPRRCVVHFSRTSHSFSHLSFSFYSLRKNNSHLSQRSARRHTVYILYTSPHASYKDWSVLLLASPTRWSKNRRVESAPTKSPKCTEAAPAATASKSCSICGSSTSRASFLASTLSAATKSDRFT